MEDDIKSSEVCQKEASNKKNISLSSKSAILDTSTTTSIEESDRSVEIVEDTIDETSDLGTTLSCSNETVLLDSTLGSVDEPEETKDVIDHTSALVSGTTTNGNENEKLSKDVTYLEGVSIDVDGDSKYHPNDDENYPAYPVHDIPSYDTEFSGVLSDIEYSMETGKKINDARPKKTCFNCLGDHNVTVCSEPLDARRIAGNRKKQLSTRVSNIRYHEDSDNKYGQFQPGKLSDHLRAALGLRHNELPMYVYRMRCLGYPPGWLKEAEVRQADMKLYDGTGQSVIHPDIEEGETEAALVKYNPDKLVNFPGFNVDTPKGTRDDWRYLSFPPMQHNHRKSEFKHFMELNRAGAYKKRKLTNEHLRNSGKADAEQSSSMELDDSGVNSSFDIEFNPPLPEEPMPPLPSNDTPSSPKERNLEMEEGEDSRSSIGYLEAKRQELLKELEISGDTKEEVQGDMKDETPTESIESKLEIPSVPDDDSENSSSSGPDSQSTSIVKHHRSHSKGFQLGVAIPSSITPFNTLPDPEKWMVDVTDHINFENLPDALGTWKQMKGLMDRVKKRMVELHGDDE